MLIWAEYCNILPIENIGMFLKPLSGIMKKKEEEKCFFKDWYENGIRVVQDIVSENGELYTFEQLKNIFNINGTFLDYQHLVHNIHPTWIIQINDNHVFILENNTNVICNIYVKNLIKAKKGSRTFHDTFVGVNEYIPQGKWQAEICNISENEWKLYFLNIKQVKKKQVKIPDFNIR